MKINPPYNRTTFFFITVGFIFFFSVAAFLTEHWFTGITTTIGQLTQTIQDLRLEIRGLQATTSFVANQVADHNARLLDLERRLEGMKKRAYSEPGPYERPESVSAFPQIVVVDEHCSGFIAAPNVVFTARHCVVDENDKPTATAHVRFVDGLAREFDVAVAGDTRPENDYAVLSGDTRGIAPIQLASRTPARDSTCFEVGYGAVRPSQYAVPCRVLGPYAEWPAMIYLAANAVGGDSGSPVADAETGEVFAIMTMSSFPVPTALAVPIARPLAAYRKWARR